ncbi:ubiquitin-associated protein 1-like [Tropilaelaps mercedesae]|uniref:Ubiquitin-associated protein 1-like n=1 Tax=Tropilaelaps mercedesae TaxID=418985 RepID=A0A1V9X853_9ACAR|nr:ubiquitin-associated protein 1-like [Tropilaelaps mercedesae]
MTRRECHPLDGIRVKISSDVRPPKSVTLPGHLFKSLLPASLSYEYDFALERRVIAEAQLERERLAKLEALQPTTVATPAATVSAGEVLTPSIPSSNASPEDSASSPPAVTNISITEFESEAFSPFDQVELQTLNDFEELNSIFGKLRTSNSAPPTPAAKETPAASACASPHDNADPATISRVATNSNNQSDLGASAVGGPLTSISSLVGAAPAPGSMKNLFDEEQLARVAKGYYYRPAPPPPMPKQQPPAPDPIKDLPSHLQALAKRFVSMGFPIGRVARAVMDLGNDEPKVVEHLCLIEKLSEEGFNERDAAQALLFNGPDLEKAREFLVSWRQLGDLGFDRRDIALALKLHKNDRDKVLDELLSKS